MYSKKTTTNKQQIKVKKLMSEQMIKYKYDTCTQKVL